MAQPLFSIDAVNVANLEELVEPVTASTVSRSLVARPDFRQVLFSMDAGQEISEHRAPFLAIVQVLSGRLRMTVGAETHTLGPHAWLSMPPDAPHALAAEEPTRFLLTMVRGTGGGAG